MKTARRPAPKQCGCVEKMNAALSSRGLELDTALLMSGRVLPRLMLAGKGSRTAILLPTFCPFCGAKEGERPGTRFYP